MEQVMGIAELAWAAGFYDGEGSTSLHGSKEIGKGGISLQIGQLESNREVLDKFQSIFPMCIMGKPYIQHNERYPNRKNPQLTLRCTRTNHVTMIMTDMWEYLGYAKKAQFQRCFYKVYQAPFIIMKEV